MSLALKKGTRGAIEASIYYGDSILDLTYATVTVNIKDVDYGSTLALTLPCQITNATLGLCRFIYEDQLPEGVYELEFEVKLPTSTIKTTSYLLAIVPEV